MNNAHSSPLASAIRRSPLAPGRWAAAALLALGLCFTRSAPAGDAPPAKEHQLKAAFLYNFTKFIEWPAQSFQDTNSPFIIGVVGTGPLCAEVERAVKDRKVNGRALLARPIETVEQARSVHLLFICGSEDARLGEFLNPPQGANILTVGESDLFVRGGGAINFVLQADKLRFEINIRAAERAGLKVSAQLQKLAKTVRNGS